MTFPDWPSQARIVFLLRRSDFGELCACKARLASRPDDCNTLNDIRVTRSSQLRVRQ